MTAVGRADRPLSETVWDTTKFNKLWTSGSASPFVWSFEGTGYGTHADYLFGWKGDALQKAMDKSECFYDGCGSIKKQAMSVANQCTVQDLVKEENTGFTFSKTYPSPPPGPPAVKMLTCHRDQGDSGMDHVGWGGGSVCSCVKDSFRSFCWPDGAFRVEDWLVRRAHFAIYIVCFS